MTIPHEIAVVVLGAIEGITEFLPVSSTGHLLIAQHWIERQSDAFNVGIQCGTLLALVVGLKARIATLWRTRRLPETRSTVLKVGVAFVLTAIGGLLLKKAGLKLPTALAPVAWATLLGGVVLLALEQWAKRPGARSEVPSWPVAIAAGLAQLVAAAAPGTSRSGATIVAAYALGMSRPASVDFSFLLGVPTLLAAGAFEILHADKIAPGEWVDLALGGFVAAVTAFLAVRWLLGYVRTHGFAVFGWYRIALGILLLAFG